MVAQPKWHFAPYLDGQVRQDPTQSEFFTSESVGSLAAALVRETIQNSLDARADRSKRVGVRFSFVTVQPQDYARYFEGLSWHLKRTLADRELPTFKEPLKFLVIEDFRTKGLTGDPTARNNDDRLSENHFYYFWRNVGRSGKSGDKRGRWGLGKSVFYTISNLNTFFGITNPVNNRDTLLLMGQAVLKSHPSDTGGDELTPYGYYGRFEDTSPHFALPITDREQTRHFCQVFKLLRWHHEQGTQSGLSIVVPQPNADLTAAEIIRAAVDQYFYPILDGTLYVRVQDQANNPILLQTGEIWTHFGNISNLQDDERQRYERLFKFTEWAQQLPDDAYVQLRPAPLDRAPTWSDDYLDDDAMAAAAQRFAETGRIAFRVPVKVQRKREKPQLAWFKVFLERDETLKRAESHFIREGITIVGIRTLTQARLRGMVVVDQEPLTTLLGDAENPSHTDWLKDSLKFKDKYEHGPSTLSFVKNSLKELAKRLTEVKAELDKDLLRDVFSLPVDETAPCGKRQKPQPQPAGAQQLPDGGASSLEIHGQTPPVRIEPSGEGVLITGDDLNGATPQRFTAEFAYDVRTGDPFKRHSPADFDLRDGLIAVYKRGVQEEAREVNRLTFLVEQPDFRVYVSGFHPYRDLKVRLRWDGVDGANETEEEPDEP
ncbi:MAG: hypothetical protein NZM00_08390 [Anaerolinea sp.]|nr:hypothetical protein [Anaerolinea sp.]